LQKKGKRQFAKFSNTSGEGHRLKHERYAAEGEQCRPERLATSPPFTLVSGLADGSAHRHHLALITA